MRLILMNRNHKFYFYFYVGGFFLLLRTGSYLLYNFFNFFDKEPKLVIPNLPSNYGEWSLAGIPSQFPRHVANLDIFSMSLSHDIHFNCFFVSKASFSCSSSSDITKMISLILAYKKSSAFFTYILSLLR